MRRDIWLLRAAILVLLGASLLGCSYLSRSSNSKPAIAVAAPPSGVEVAVGEEVLVKSTAVDDVGVTRVELIADGISYRVDPAPEPDGRTPFEVSQPWVGMTPGNHSLVLRAYDSEGLASDPASLWITVVDRSPAEPSPSVSPSAEPTATASSPTPTVSSSTVTPIAGDHIPSVSVAAPASGLSVALGGEVVVSASATDDVGVRRIELWVDGELVDLEEGAGASPMEASLTWIASPEGEHALQVKALDTSWQSSEIATLRMTVEPAKDGGITPIGRYGLLWRDELGGPSASIGLATSDAVVRLAAEQFFEHGYMFWRDNLGASDVIYVLYFGDGANETAGTWDRFQDSWTEGDPKDSCPAETPPTGMYKPYRGFGRVWCTAAGVKASIGWSTQEKETPLEGNAGFQDFQHGVMLWSGRQDAIYVLYDDGGWRRYRDEYEG